MFTWQWWLLVALCLLGTLAFVVLIDRRFLVMTVAYLGLIYLLNKNLDDWATAMDWYDYRMQLEPIIPTMLPANLFMVPIFMSLLYSRLRRWTSYLIGLCLFAAAVSYAALPLMKLAGIYLEKAWNPHLSLLTLILMGVLSKWIVDKLSKVQQRAKARGTHHPNLEESRSS